jgi:hypothetical protein
MKTKYFLYNIIFLTPLLVLSLSCKKFLDAKPDQKLVIPSNLQDLQALLDNNTVMNTKDIGGIMEASSDNYYMPESTYGGLLDNLKRTYIWGENIFIGYPNSWANVYDRVYVANTVLKGLESIERTEANKIDWDNIKGQALFHRGKAFFEGALVWSDAFDEATADADLGIPLRLELDFNLPSVRPSVRQTYQQIESDLVESAELLPTTPIHVMRAGKPAANAMLARVYISKREYSKAGIRADLCLQSRNTLLDFNNTLVSSSWINYSIAPTATTASCFIRVFGPDNPELIMYSFGGLLINNLAINSRVDSFLYNTYSVNDKRKTIWFRTFASPTSYAFRGSYNGNAGMIWSVTTGEVYLMRAECFARAGNKDAALADLDTLLKRRISPFTPTAAVDAAGALDKILEERRKELLYRGVRWMDLKRLNKEGANIRIKRIIGGITYQLEPNDPKYALPIPSDIIAMSGMQQNPR